MADLCTNEECTSPVRNKTLGLCRKCNHKRINGDTHCIYEDCQYPVKSRGLCNTHYVHWRAGRIDVDVPDVAYGRTLVRNPSNTAVLENKATTFTLTRLCTRYGCKAAANYGDFCGWHKTDDRFGTSPKCAIEDCTRAATFIPKTGYCPEHRSVLA